MNQVSRISASALPAGDCVELRRLLPATDRSARRQSTPGDKIDHVEPRIFQLDAGFKSAGVWSGVSQLVETAYLGLLAANQREIIEEHQLELYMVLLNYRHEIHPKYLCLTDTASAGEKTRFYAADRAYRLVHGLVGMILQWKRTQHDERNWVVIVRNFDHAQHLATRFFVELARRSATEGGIDVVIETRYHQPDLMPHLPKMLSVPAALWIAALPPVSAPSRDFTATEIELVETQISEGGDIQFEQSYPTLLNYYRSTGDDLAAARIALRIFIIYNSYGYYYEAKDFLSTILPYFDQLVGADEDKRIHYVSKMNICLVMTDDPAGALRVVEELAESYLIKPHLVANMHYILGMHYLRYAEAKDLARAEHHILRAVDNIAVAKNLPELAEYPFRKVFIDNGLAFLRARQGRHQEALDLCRTGYEFLTREMGEDRHLLHRSVLQYNIAQVYVMLGRLDEGLEYYRNAIAMDPNYSEYYNEAGNILQEQDRYQEAIEYYERAIECSAPYPEVHFNKAVCHARLGETQAALISFHMSLELNPQQPEGLALQADTLQDLERFDEALESYDAAIALGYDSAAARVNRAVLHYNNGSYGLALADLNHVIAADANEAAHYENRAAIYKAMNLEDLHLRDIEMAERCRQAASC